MTTLTRRKLDMGMLGLSSSCMYMVVIRLTAFVKGISKGSVTYRVQATSEGSYWSPGRRSRSWLLSQTAGFHTSCEAPALHSHHGSWTRASRLLSMIPSTHSGNLCRQDPLIGRLYCHAPFKASVPHVVVGQDSPGGRVSLQTARQNQQSPGWRRS